jgi:dipeptidase
LPDEIGGVVWFGVDDTYFTCYVPFYACMDKVTGPFATGNIQEFDLSSAWWAFNLVSNYVNIKYSYMIKDIQAVQNDLEEGFLNEQTAVERTAMDLKKKKELNT